MIQEDRLRVLFLCSGNSCRSQMAEGGTRALHPKTIEAYSAGIERNALQQRAVTVMNEINIDIARQRSKTIAELGDIDIDYVITLCCDAANICPTPPATSYVVLVPFDSPRQSAAKATTEDAALTHYRRVRDEIGEFVERLPDWLAGQAKPLVS